MLRNCCRKALTYFVRQVRDLQEICILKPNSPAWSALKDAFDASYDELLPMRQAEECAARAAIDEGAAPAFGLSPEIPADWRRRLAAEPTVTNRPAPGLEAA